MEIRHYLTDANLERMIHDCEFLLETVRGSHGELDLALRDDYFNVYYQGNSLAKVMFLPGKEYEVVIHEKFFRGTKAAAKFRYETGGGGRFYAYLRVRPSKLPRLLQKTTILELQANIRKVNYGEEITFEQLLISDNPPSDTFFLIDRQVTDTHLKGRRLDLLGLQNVGENRYRFLVIEVKLGKNPELKAKVAEQLQAYVDHLSGDAFAAYKACYERNYEQKRALGLLPLSHERIDIQGDVQGLVVVSGYSGVGLAQIAQLKSAYPDIAVKQFRYHLMEGASPVALA